MSTNFNFADVRYGNASPNRGGNDYSSRYWSSQGAGVPGVGDTSASRFTQPRTGGAISSPYPTATGQAGASGASGASGQARINQSRQDILAMTQGRANELKSDPYYSAALNRLNDPNNVPYDAATIANLQSNAYGMNTAANAAQNAQLQAAAASGGASLNDASFQSQQRQNMSTRQRNNMLAANEIESNANVANTQFGLQRDMGMANIRAAQDSLVNQSLGHAVDFLGRDRYAEAVENAGAAVGAGLGAYGGGRGVPDGFGGEMSDNISRSRFADFSGGVGGVYNPENRITVPRVGALGMVSPEAAAAAQADVAAKKAAAAAKNRPVGRPPLPPPAPVHPVFNPATYGPNAGNGVRNAPAPGQIDPFDPATYGGGGGVRSSPFPPRSGTSDPRNIWM